MKFCPRSNSFISRQRLARQRELQDRHGRGVVAQDVGRRDAGRQQLQHGLRRRRHLRQRRADIDALLEEDLDDAIAAQRLRLDVLDVADLGGQRALVVIDDAARHVVRQQPGVSPDDADHRHVDVRKNIGRRPQRPPARRRSRSAAKKRQRYRDAGARSERSTRRYPPKNRPEYRFPEGCRRAYATPRQPPSGQPRSSMRYSQPAASVRNQQTPNQQTPWGTSNSRIRNGPARESRALAPWRYSEGLCSRHIRFERIGFPAPERCRTGRTKTK